MFICTDIKDDKKLAFDPIKIDFFFFSLSVWFTHRRNKTEQEEGEKKKFNKKSRQKIKEEEK